MHDWASRQPHDFCNMDSLKRAQELWSTNPPDKKLQLKREFPTTRRDALKIPWAAMARCESHASPEYAAAIGRVLGPFPDPIRRTLSYIFLNYLAPHQQFVQAQGRHLFMLKSYRGKQESICWFIPLAQVQTMHAAASESLRQGISYNDLALTQTYAVESVLAVHAETWEPRNDRVQPGSENSRNAYGECTWIGGMAFHYALGEQAQAASHRFAELPPDEMAEVAAQKAKAKEKKARQKANRKARAKEEEERLREEARAAEQEEQSSRRAGLVKVHESLAEALAKGSLLKP